VIRTGRKTVRNPVEKSEEMMINFGNLLPFFRSRELADDLMGRNCVEKLILLGGRNRIFQSVKSR
jgi:hypothetical protein